MTFKAQLLCLAYMSAFGTDYTNHHRACEYAQSIVEVGSTYDVEPELLMAIIKKESNFQSDIGPNKAGACGLGQQIPKFTSMYANKSYTCSEIKNNPHLSIVLIAKAIRWLQSSYTLKEGVKHYSENNMKWTLCMYSAGPNACPESSWRATRNGSSYARTVLKYVDKIKIVQGDIEAYLTYP